MVVVGWRGEIRAMVMFCGFFLWGAEEQGVAEVEVSARGVGQVEDEHGVRAQDPLRTMDH